jgi:hypothetical protein
MSSVELEERQGEVEVETVPSRGRAGEDDDLEQGEDDDLEQGERDDPEHEDDDDFQEEERRGPARFKDSHVVTRRVDRVLGFFSNRPNWDYPTPSPAGECVPPPFCSGGDTLACGICGGGSQFGRRYIHCGTLGIYVLREVQYGI